MRRDVALGLCAGAMGVQKALLFSGDGPSPLRPVAPPGSPKPASARRGSNLLRRFKVSLGAGREVAARLDEWTASRHALVDELRDLERLLGEPGRAPQVFACSSNSSGRSSFDFHASAAEAASAGCGARFGLCLPKGAVQRPFLEAGEEEEEFDEASPHMRLFGQRDPYGGEDSWLALAHSLLKGSRFNGSREAAADAAAAVAAFALPGTSATARGKAMGGGRFAGAGSSSSVGTLGHSGEDAEGSDGSPADCEVDDDWLCWLKEEGRYDGGAVWAVQDNDPMSCTPWYAHTGMLHRIEECSNEDDEDSTCSIAESGSIGEADRNGGDRSSAEHLTDAFGHQSDSDVDSERCDGNQSNSEGSADLERAWAEVPEVGPGSHQVVPADT